eukprot:TRINITY_DN24374_c0_g1_i1.p1 TRINITY_DN24374_c0_g1~~TRINITY_DN24374_c0_g1_i1.p1  ORF type:complete len:585 (-),score=99.53 TRINITY_DN24374_c0_g1_i1:262-1860(-)
MSKGMSDPYCIAMVKGRPISSFKTEVLKKTLSPEWNCKGTIDTCKHGDPLQFSLMDHDVGSADDSLGNAELEFDQFYPAGFSGEIEVIDPKNKGEPPKLMVEVQIEPLRSAISDLRCFVKVVKAEGLRAADFAIAGGKSDPYCIVAIPGKEKQPGPKFRTKVKSKTVDPVWEEEDEVHGFVEGDTLSFTLWDYDMLSSDDLLGEARLPSAAFFPDGFEGWVELDSQGSVYVEVDVEMPEEEIIQEHEIPDPGAHVGARDREPAPFSLRSLDHGKRHRLVAYTRIGRSERRLERGVDLILDTPGICDVGRLHAVIKCWRGIDASTWMARIYCDKGREGFGEGSGGGHAGGGTSVDGEAVDPKYGTALEMGCTIRFGVREMWVLEGANMAARSQEAELAANRAAANASEDPARVRDLRVDSAAMESSLQRCPDWFSFVRVVLESRFEPDEPPCVDRIEVQDEVGRPVSSHECDSIELQNEYNISDILKDIVVGSTVRLRLSSDPKLLAIVLDKLNLSNAAMNTLYKERQEFLGS